MVKVFCWFSKCKCDFGESGGNEEEGEDIWRLLSPHLFFFSNHQLVIILRLD